MADQVTHQSNSQNTEQTADLTELISTGWDLPRLWGKAGNGSNSGRGQSIHMRELRSEDYGSGTETDSRLEILQRG